VGKRSKNLSHLCVKRMLKELEIPAKNTESSNLLNYLQSYTILFLHLMFFSNDLSRYPVFNYCVGIF
jgi:hypothetical protein